MDSTVDPDSITDVVYVITGECGDYDDRNWWTVRAFTNENTANKYKDLCQKRADEIEECCTKNRWTHGFQRPISELDPGMTYDWAFYDVEKVTLDKYQAQE